MADARIGYLLKAFPVVSETFILNEVRAMERAGVPLAVLALKPRPRGVVHASVAEVSSPCRWAPAGPLRALGLLIGHVGLLWSGPQAYVDCLRHEVGRFLPAFWRRPTIAGWKVVRKRLRRFIWAGWVVRQVRQLGVRHLHAHYAGEPLRVAHLVRRWTGVPYSFTAHAKDLYLAPTARLRRRLATASFAVACHQHGAETLRRLADESDATVHFVRHGVDTEAFGPQPRQASRRILAIGRLTPKKGFDDLIAACAVLAQRDVDFRCDILGDGRQREALERAVRRARLSARVTIHGFVAQEELGDWHRKAHLLAAPCKELADGNRDGVPNVVVEAMASGLPVVATAAAGLPEIIDTEVDGLLVAPRDPEALANALQRLLEDSELAARLGAAAARKAASLDFRGTNEPLAAAFRRVLEAPVDDALEAAEKAAWGDRGMARKAAKRLGLAPERDAAIEQSIRRAVRPGLLANAWRPDLDRLAARRLWDEVIKARRLRRLMPLLIGHPAGGDPRILDLGCGRGGLAVALAAHGFSVTGLDLRFRNCAVTRLRGRRYGLHVPALTAVGERLPFADASFDAVGCLEVLEHVQDPAALLREIRRVLAPGGRCAVTVINRWAHFDPHYHLWGVNFLPRRWANRYIALRRRTKRSYRDCQTLDEMHYFTYGAFARLVDALGFRLVDPEIATGGWRGLARRARTVSSLGFNTRTLVLVRPAGEATLTSPRRERRPLDAVLPV